MILLKDTPVTTWTPTPSKWPLSRWMNWSPGRRDIVFALVALVVGIIVILPGRDGAGTSISGMQLAASMFAMIVASVGLNLLVGYTRLVSLGQGGFYAIGAYGSAWLSLNGGMPALVAIVVSIVAAGVVGAIVAVASMRLRGPQFAVITLILAVLVETVLTQGNTFGRLAGYPNTGQHGTGTLEPLSVLGITLNPPMIANERATVMIPLMVITVLVVVLARNIVRSSWGRSLSAIGESEMLASHLGVNVFGRKVAVFVLASVLGALGGVFATQAFGHLQPETFDIFLTITIVLAVVLGGSGTVLGPVVGAVVIVWLEQSDLLTQFTTFQQDHVSDKWFLSSSGIVGLLFIIVLFLMPRGIVGTLGRVLDGVLHRRRTAQGDPMVDLESAFEPDFVAPEQRSPVGDELLVVSGVSKRFGGLKAVDRMDLVVRAGSIHAVIGPNGAGKSTLANLLTGVYRPDEGSVAVGGEDVAGRTPHVISRSGVSRTFQTPQLFHSETVRENVLAGFSDTGSLPLWRAAFKLPAQYRREAAMKARAEELINGVGLGDVAHLRASELPYGKQRALEIARALASDPKVLVLDEPAAGLHATETSALGDLLLVLRERGLALVVVEHHMDLVSRVADDVTCMDQGGLLARGNATQVLADPAVITAYLGASVGPEEQA